MGEVDTVSVLREDARYVGMADGFSGIIWLKVSLRHVGLMLRFMHEHVIPRPILGRTTECHLLIPFLCSLKRRIHVDDYATVIESFVVDYLTNIEFCPSCCHV
jgi:hypothetical protein